MKILYRLILVVCALFLIVEFNIGFYIRHYAWILKEYGQFHGKVFVVSMCGMVDFLIMLTAVAFLLIPKMFED